MIIVHLPGMRNDRDRVCLGQGGNLAGLGEAAEAIGIELDVVQRAGLEQVTETVGGELVFAACDWNAPIRLQFSVTVHIIRNDRLFQPSQLKGFEERQYAL